MKKLLGAVLVIVAASTTATLAAEAPAPAPAPASGSFAVAPAVGIAVAASLASLIFHLLHALARLTVVLVVDCYLYSLIWRSIVLSLRNSDAFSVDRCMRLFWFNLICLFSLCLAIIVVF